MLARAKQSLAGGDSSTMRVLPYHLPLVADRGEGCRLWDIDGREYIDMNMAYGPLLLGHRPKAVIESVTRQISDRGSQLGFPTEITTRVAEKVKKLYPSIELLRFANSGTEAIASAVRLARTVTGRRKLILFEGNYHGWSEAVFHKYHAPVESLPERGYGPAIPGTTGMGDMDAVVVRWNNLEVFHRALEEHGDSIAAVVLEPVMGNAGLLPPREDFLPGLREATQANGSMLIFDEVITGCRVAPGGAQELYGVYPDITVVSKAIGGGYPISAFGASRELMDVIVNGPLFHGGVFSGNAVVMSAAEAVLDTLIAHGDSVYAHLNAVTDRLCDGIESIFARLGVPAFTQHVGAVASLFLTDGQVDALHEYRDVRRHCRFDRFIELQHAAQSRGVYFHPNQFEPMFPSVAHRPEDIDEALNRIEDAARCALT
ncbi:aspartate aminotransferase family protein [Botrimarina sp.]|uniref:aspartate aminotransferase family protein n=1 Tax=Botrimarina sp. TaxID=2795802 RepID=UPI0032EFCAA0